MSSFITKRAKELGLKKIDAKAPLQFEVCRSDITAAKKKKPDACAFARACTRQKQGIKNAYFFRSTAWLQYKDKFVRYLLPPAAQKEIVAFDRNKTMEPGKYQISPPNKSARMSAVKKRSAKRPGRHQPGNGKIKRKYVHHTTNIRSVFAPL